MLYILLIFLVVIFVSYIVYLYSFSKNKENNDKNVDMCRNEMCEECEFKSYCYKEDEEIAMEDELNQ